LPSSKKCQVVGFASLAAERSLCRPSNLKPVKLPEEERKKERKKEKLQVTQCNKIKTN
jgi:hypothetical protein